MTATASITTVANPFITPFAILGRVVDHIMLHPLVLMFMVVVIVMVVMRLVPTPIPIMMMMVMAVGILQRIGRQPTHCNAYQYRRFIVTERLRLIDAQGACRSHQNGHRQQF